MKRMLALSLVLMMLATTLFPVQAFAQYDKDLEKVIGIAKSTFDISGGYDIFNYNINKQNGKTVFQLMWNDSKNKLGSIDVTIESNGRITNYYSYRPYDERNRRKLPAVSKTDANKTANEFLRRVCPDSSNKLKYVASNLPLNINDRAYLFNYVRTENNIPYPENGATVSVDAMTGQVNSFNYLWYDEAVFPGPDGVMDLPAAQVKYIGKLGLQLAYKLNYGENESKPYLVYTGVYNNFYMDAKSGEITNVPPYYGINYMNEAAKDIGGYGGGEVPGRSMNSGPLTPEEQKAVEGAADIITQQKAEQIARQTLNIDSGFKLNYVSLYNSWINKDNYTWSMDFSKQEKGSDYYGANVTIDAKTGEVLYFYKSSPYNEKDMPKYTREQSLKIAEDYIKSVQPEKTREVEYTNWRQTERQPWEGNEPPREYYFNFTRKANGAYFIDNGFTVAVDTAKGTITSYSLNWYKKDLPAGDNVISADRANQVFLDQIGIQLQYVSTYPAEATKKIIPPPYDRPTPVIKLVYGIKPGKPVNVDPFTGKLLDYDGKPYETGNLTQYTDIRGCYAENQIKVLAEYGISLPGTQLKPDQAITQREFLYLLHKSVNPYIVISLSPDGKDDDALYKSLMALGLVKEGERSPGAVVSKQDAVKFIIRALNYDKIAEIKKGIFCPATAAIFAGELN